MIEDEEETVIAATGWYDRNVPIADDLYDGYVAYLKEND